MYKCETCGTEFESKFCPNCGTPAPMEACPSCGAKLSPTDKFCPQCGCTLRAGISSVPQPKPNYTAQGASPASIKALGLLPFAFSVLFAVCCAVLFLSYIGPVMGGLLAFMGNVYDTAGSAGTAMGGTAANVCLCLVLFTAIALVYAVVLLIFRFSIPLRVMRTRKGAGRMRISDVLERAAYVLYLILLILSCILCAETGFAIGAGAVCTLVFTLFFFLLSAAAHIGWACRKTFFPRTADALEKRKEAARAEMGKPAPFDKPQEPKKPELQAVVEETDELRGQVNKHLRRKRASYCFTVSTLPFFCLAIALIASFRPNRAETLGVAFPIITVIGLPSLAIIYAIVVSIVLSARKKPEGWHPERVSVRNDLLALAVIGMGAAILALIFTIVCIVRSGLRGDFFLPACTTIICFIFNIPAIVSLKHGKKLTVRLFGVKNPWKSPEIMAPYEAEMKVYNEEYSQYRQALAKYREARYRRACYEEGKKVASSSL